MDDYFCAKMDFSGVMYSWVYVHSMTPTGQGHPGPSVLGFLHVCRHLKDCLNEGSARLKASNIGVCLPSMTVANMTDQHLTYNRSHEAWTIPGYDSLLTGKQLRKFSSPWSKQFKPRDLSHKCSKLISTQCTRLMTLRTWVTCVARTQKSWVCILFEAFIISYFLFLLLTKEDLGSSNSNPY